MIRCPYIHWLIVLGIALYFRNLLFAFSYPPAKLTNNYNFIMLSFSSLLFITLLLDQLLIVFLLSFWYKSTNICCYGLNHSSNHVDSCHCTDRYCRVEGWTIELTMQSVNWRNHLTTMPSSIDGLISSYPTVMPVMNSKKTPSVEHVNPRIAFSIIVHYSID